MAPLVGNSEQAATSTTQSVVQRLFGRTRRLQLAFTGLYQARWSAEIDDEWKRNLLAARPELAERLDRTHAVMHRAIPGKGFASGRKSSYN